MSAYLSSADALNALATYWERKASRGYSDPKSEILRTIHCQRRALGATSGDYATDMKADEKAFNAIMAAHKGNALKTVFGILLIENQNSLKARYPDGADMWETDPTYVGRSIPVVDQWIQQGVTGQLVGILNGYEYQACEHEGWRTSLAFFICQQIRSHLLKDFEARCCPVQENGARGNWADYTAPKDGPKLVSLSELAKR